MACLWKHPACKNWFARYTNAEGKQVNRTTATPDRNTAQVLADGWAHTEKLARQGVLTAARARQVVSEILERTSYGDKSLHVLSITEFFENWLETRCASKAAGTSAKYSTVVRRFLSHLGVARSAKPMTTVRTGDAQGYVDKRGKNASSKTVGIDVKLLAAVFTYAQKQGVISKNPMLGVELPKGGGL